MAALGIKPTCVNPKNLFCFVCGRYIKSHHKRSLMTKPLIDAYEAFFEKRTSKENYEYGPPSVCNDCNIGLLRWSNGLSSSPDLSFDVPMLWSKPMNHQLDCFFCLTRSFATEPVSYPPDLLSAIRPRVGQSNGLPGADLHKRQASSAPRGWTALTAVAGARNTKLPAPTAGSSPKRQIKLQDRKPIPIPTSRRQVIKQPEMALPAGTKRKYEAQQGASTYDVTKVRLRGSEPSVVLEQSEKHLPQLASPVPGRLNLRRTAITTRAHTEPQITGVFSLSGPELSAYDSFAASPTQIMHAANGSDTKPITIEIEDDDDDEAETKLKEEKLMMVEKQEQIDDQEKEQVVETNTEAWTKKPRQEVKEEEKAAQIPVENPPDDVPSPAASHLQENFAPQVKVKCMNITNPRLSSPSCASGMVMIESNLPRQPAAGTPHLITQSELVLLLRELDMNKEKSAILIKRFKRWNLLAPSLIGSRDEGTLGKRPPTATTMLQWKPSAPSPKHSTELTPAPSVPGFVKIQLPKPPTPQVIRTSTGNKAAVGSRYTIVNTPQLVQSNTITTSHGRTATGKAVPILRTQLGAARSRTAPAKQQALLSSS